MHCIACFAENTCMPLGTVPEGYDDLDINCTQVTECRDLAAACAVGYIGEPSARTCLENGSPFENFTGCTGARVMGLASWQRKDQSGIKQVVLAQASYVVVLCSWFGDPQRASVTLN